MASGSRSGLAGCFQALEITSLQKLLDAEGGLDRDLLIAWLRSGGAREALKAEPKAEAPLQSTKTESKWKKGIFSRPEKMQRLQDATRTFMQAVNSPIESWGQAAVRRLHMVCKLIHQLSLASSQVLDLEEEKPQTSPENKTAAAAAPGTPSSASGDSSGTPAAEEEPADEDAGGTTAFDRFLKATAQKMPQVYTRKHIERPEWYPADRFELLTPSMRELFFCSEASPSVAIILREFQRQNVRLIRNLVEANPIAFNEIAALDAESEVSSTTSRAQAKLSLLKKLPNDSGVRHAFSSSLQQLRAQRPFFIQPLIDRDSYNRAEVQQDAVPVVRVWELESSIFAKRKPENESRGFYDSEKVLKRQFDIDWSRVIEKERFLKLVKRSDNSASTATAELQKELNEIRDELFSVWPMIRSAFMYFSMYHSRYTGTLEMTMGEFQLFAESCKLSDESTKYCRIRDIQTMFIATNYEEEGAGQEAEANDDDALVRFEMLEILVRVAFARYIVEGLLDDASDSLNALFNEHMLPRLPLAARIIPNDFRRERLYSEEMECVVTEYFTFLQGAYQVHKAHDKQKFQDIKHFEQCIQNTGLLDCPGVNLDRKTLRLVFVHSQMQVSDELKRRRRATSITLFDFIEALARIADYLDPPTLKELDRYYLATAPALTNNKLWEYYQRIGATDAKVPVTPIGETPKNPAHENFSRVLEIMVIGLSDAWGGKNQQECGERMMRTAKTLNGGVELCR